MSRFKLTIEYDGRPFVGWQVQKNGVSVQGQLHKAVVALSGVDFVPFGAGRTDAGVHARGQVAHIDLPDKWEVDKVRDGLNYHLKPDPIAVIGCELVDDEFDARFSATMRAYHYKIINRRAKLTLERGMAWHVARPLNEKTMATAAQDFVGVHDFTTFRSTHCQAKTAVKSIDCVQVQRVGDHIYIDVSARSFMHNQVRSMVGSLVEVGLGKWPVSGIRDALLACERTMCGPVAPAHGLYFMSVGYENQI